MRFELVYKHMGFVRKVLLIIITPLLSVLLFATAIDFGILSVAGSPAPAKHFLADSGIYNGVISSALDQAQKSAGSSNQVALDDQAVISAAKSVFTPQLLQQSTEQAIDGVFNWLNGKTAQPDFNIDLTSQKLSFAQKVGQFAQQHATTLPACTAVADTTDPLSATCLPRGVTPAQVGQQAQNDIITAQGFLNHPNITASDIKKSGTNQSVFATGKLQSAPKKYQLVKKTPYIFAGLTLLTIVVIILLSTTRRKGV